MKKIPGIIALSLVMIALSCQQRAGSTKGEQEPPVVVDSTQFTTIAWLDSTFHDMGTIKEGPEVEVAFKFKNTGDKNLVIEDVHPGCGCTAVDKPKEPFAPGQEGTIKAKFNSAGTRNMQQKTITVVANTKGTQQHILTFKIFVEPKS